MKKALRFLLYLILFAVLVVGGFALYVQVRGIPKYEVDKIEFKPVTPDSASVALGEKIASVQCVICHRGSDGKLSGRPLPEIPEMFGELHSANITHSKEHGIGKWADGQIAYFLRTGVKPSGQFVPHYMPKFPHMSETDLRAVIAYLRSDRPELQPSEIATVPCKPSWFSKFLATVAIKKVPYPKEAVADPDTADLVAYGKYLTTGRYDCYPCHSQSFETTNLEVPENTPGYMGGGNKLKTPNGNIIYTANLTPDEETGIGTWTEDDFRNAMLYQKTKSGHPLRQPMLPMTVLNDLEIRAMYKYLMSIPKIKNKVDRQYDNEDL